MSTEADPIVGTWYQHLDKGEMFEVVAVDQEQGLIEIQYFDGDVDEIDIEEWYDLNIEPGEEPEDWTGPVDDIEHDDLNYSETDMEEEDWTGPFNP